MIKNAYQKVKNIIRTHKYGLVTLCYAILHAALTYYCLELGNKNPFLNGFFYTVINILTIFVLQSVVYIIVRRRWIASLLTGIPLTILSIANYYTLVFRNSPISTQDIHNFGTALSVIDSYSFPISAFVIGILAFFVLQIAVVIRLYRREKGKKSSFKYMALKNIAMVLFCTAFMHLVYFSQNPIKPQNTFVWSWEDSYHKFGYAASSIEVFQNSINMIERPEDYSEEDLMNIQKASTITKTNERTPDIILILNETFYDMRDLIDIKTDVPVMPFIDSLKHKGRTVVAGTGGGTNKSEYELLTSNSLWLMPAITPFNYLNFDDANSIVGYLKDMGYKTWGGHPAEPLNYAREIVYPKLGFDDVLFRDDFGEIGKYGARPYATDESCYNKMLEDYEKMGDAPRFQYLLTIQNHGGWDLNPSKEDTVHLTDSFGEHTELLNEYMSCVKRTDEAFKKLTEYFEDCDRDVIICMVGDHAPSFATELVDHLSLDVTFKLRSTPYVVWANFDIDDYVFPKTVSMPNLVPLMLDAADVPLSPYYSHMLKLCNDVPVVTAFGVYKTADEEVYHYRDNTDYTRDINIYFNMVYNNVAKDANRIDRLFIPQKENLNK